MSAEEIFEDVFPSRSNYICGKGFGYKPKKRRKCSNIDREIQEFNPFEEKMQLMKQHYDDCLAQMESKYSTLREEFDQYKASVGESSGNTSK